jgi:short-subunit dehydrogenase
MTGAAGGIGSAVALQLADQGAQLMLAGRNAGPLEALAGELRRSGGMALPVAADITTANGRTALMQAVRQHWQGAVDILINGAGVMDFAPFESLPAESIHRVMATNVEAPMQLTHLLLPGMLERNRGSVVCIGSILGTLAMPYFTTYSASKFALRGFAEGLRRELKDTGVSVCYIGPRSVQTSLNGAAVRQLAAATGMNVDDPNRVARQIVKAIARGVAEVNLGFPEALLARINSMLPRLVDLAMIGQRRKMAPFARPAS